MNCQPLPLPRGPLLPAKPPPLGGWQYGSCDTGREASEASGPKNKSGQEQKTR